MSAYIHHKPQIHLANSTAFRMWLISACAGAAILQSAFSDSFSSLMLAIAALAGALVAELAVNTVSGRYTIKDGSAVASALIFTLMLPNQLHPGYAAVASLFAVIVIKHGFGGIGAHWLNPSLGAWLFVRLSWPIAYETALSNSMLSMLKAGLEKGMTDPSGSPLALLKVASYKIPAFDASISSALNSFFFSNFGAELPGGYIGLFALPGPGIIADRGLFALLLGTILVGSFKINKYWIPGIFVAVYLLLIRLFGGYVFGGAFCTGDMLFSLLSGASVLGAFLLAVDPSSSTKSYRGSVLAAVLAAALSFFFRFSGNEPYGIFFAIAVINICIPIIRNLEDFFIYKIGRKP